MWHPVDGKHGHNREQDTWHCEQGPVWPGGGISVRTALGLCRRLQNHGQPAGGRGDAGPSLDSIRAWPCPLSKVPQILLCCRRRQGRGWPRRPGVPSARGGATPESSAAFPEPAQLAPSPRPRSRLAPSSVLCGSARAPGSFSLHLLTPRGNPCKGSTGPHPPGSAPEPPGRGARGGGARDARRPGCQRPPASICPRPLSGGSLTPAQSCTGGPGTAPASTCRTPASRHPRRNSRKYLHPWSRASPGCRVTLAGSQRCAEQL